MGNVFLALISAPSIYVPEVLGLAVLVWFTWLILRRRTIFYSPEAGELADPLADNDSSKSFLPL